MRHETSLLLTAVLFATIAGTGCSTREYEVQSDAQQRQLEEANQRIAELESQNRDLDQRLVEASSAVELAHQEKAELEASIAGLESRQAELQRQRDEEIEKLTSENAAEAEAAARRIRDLNAHIRTLRAEIEDESTLSAAKDTGIAQLEENVRRLNSEIASQTDAIGSLQNEKDSLDSQLAAVGASKTNITTILGILLAVFVITTIVGFARGRK